MHTEEVQLLTNEGWDERILVCQNGDLVKTFIVITARFVVLVDTMINATTGAKLLEIARPHLNGRQLLVVNTHADYDHVWGNQVFAGPEALQPAPIIGSRFCIDQFNAPNSQAFIQQMMAEEPDAFGDLRPAPPNVLFDERLVIDGGDLTLELFATPGHTPDHVAIYIPEIKTLLAADAAEVPFPFARTIDGLPQMRQSLAQMAALNPTTVLYCHAPTTIGPQLLHDNIAYFDKVEAACRAALARGVPADAGEDEDVAALVGLSYDEAVPSGEHWQNVHEDYRTGGHEMQIRTMLEYVSLLE
ncbi:MAG TPA: MBL fold metallo-hydrolase [Anaerolineae bacterium]